MNAHVMAWAKANHRTKVTRCACKVPADITSAHVHSIGPDRWSLVNHFVCAVHGPMIESTRLVRDRAHATVAGPMDALIDQGSHVVRAL